MAIEVEESTRTLGVHINPALRWKSQFEVMLITSISKFMNMDINLYQTDVYFNTHMIKSVLFSIELWQ